MQNQFAHTGNYGEEAPIFYCIKYRETKGLLLKSVIDLTKDKKDYYQKKSASAGEHRNNKIDIMRNCQNV